VKRRLILVLVAVAVVGLASSVAVVGFGPRVVSKARRVLHRETSSSPSAAHAVREYDAGYDPARDPQQDLETASVEAKRDGKHILVLVGGNWCPWCKILASSLQEEPDVAQLLQNHFVALKVSFSPENENEELLSRFPPIDDYPHIFVLDEEGGLLVSQDADDLMDEKSYSSERLLQFLERWKP
jgi:thioredoxin-related protein